MSVVALICCYGVVDKNLRSAVEYQGLQQYFSSCYQHLSDLKSQNQLDAIVFCGGYRFSDISESQSSSQYFNNLGTNLVTTPQFLEQTSHSSIQNLALGYLTISENFVNSDLLIICDSNRQQKIEILSQKLFQSLAKSVKVVSFDRPDIHPSSNLDSQKDSLDKDLQLGEVELWQQILTLNSLNFKNNPTT